MKNIVNGILSFLIMMILMGIVYYCFRFGLVIPFVISTICCFICIAVSLKDAREFDDANINDEILDEYENNNKEEKHIF